MLRAWQAAAAQQVGAWGAVGMLLGALPAEVAAAVPPMLVGALAAWLFGLFQGPQSSAQELPRQYDFGIIGAYWRSRPLQMMARLFETTRKVGAWVYALVQDIQRGEEQQFRRQRAIEARELVTDLGVTFIKIAQVWASRPDIVPEEYLEEFGKLLQNVRPFSREEALATLTRARKDGKPLLDMFDDASCFDKPVASASVGQVYKATVGGRTVAVKVQRPGVREQSSLDLFLTRSAGELGQFIPYDPVVRQCKQLVELMDLSAPNFMRELDYEAEAANQRRFAETVAACDLICDTIVVPEVIHASQEVLVQEWLDGAKLNEPGAAQDQAGRVVKLLLNSYMVQFLETGYLHGDPHPGNFILMKNGKLGILDYGLMTTITREKRLTFIEFLMHLQAKEYNCCFDDLIALEFFPQAMATDTSAREIILPALIKTLSTLYEEGGDLQSKKEAFHKQYQDFQSFSKMDGVRQELQEMTKKYAGSFKLPPYFTLILRAFATLEGLGLKTDKDFAIVKECFPYIARRLLTDDSLRMRKALKSYLYKGQRRISPTRIDEIATGFGKFTNLMAGSAEESANAGGLLAVGSERSSKQLMKVDQASIRTGLEPLVLDSATKDIVEVIFSPEGNFLQDLLIDEGVAAVDALSRAALVNLLKSLGPLSLPISLPLGFILGARARGNDILAPEDREALLVIQRIVQLVRGTPDSTRGQEVIRIPDIWRVAQDLQRLRPLAEGLLPTVVPGAVPFARRFAQQLARRILMRIADDIEQMALGPFLRPTTAAA